MLSIEVIRRLADKYNVNTDVVPIGILHKAIEIEHEHKDVIGDNIETAFRIAMAHLREYPDYYQRLIKMESKADKYWSGKVKPTIYNGNVRAKAEKVGITRTTKTKEIKQRRARKDTYGVRKGARARRTAHFYPDYIPKQEKRKSEVERDVSRRATADGSVQTEST